MQALNILLIYLSIINLTAFIAFGIDKRRARRGAFRISEGSLFTLALFGGSLGSLLGMYIFRHKTLKPSFTIGMPVIFFLQLLIILVIVFIKPIELSFM
ncbi:MAG: DUF1294 domain-containing protein [Lachnospiraceae bacterium]|nr:DUF1294 domain-containing protein [Lachnospiraceae bacterium]